MKVILLGALKGGTGKTTLTALLGRALRDKGYHVGLLDLDILAPNLHLALGLESPPSWELDTVAESVKPTQVDGLELITMASHFGRGTRILWQAEEKITLVKEILSGVIAWDHPDFLLVDCPPSNGEEVVTLLESLKDPYGALVVTQPADFAVEDAERLLDLLTECGTPLIGLVANMDGVQCPHCNQSFYAFATRRVDLAQFCAQRGLPYLLSIPQTNNLASYGAALAEKVLSQIPYHLPAGKLRRRLQRQIIKRALEKSYDEELVG